MNMNQCKQWIQGHADLAIDLVRIYLGLGLFFKAIYFMSHRDDLIRLLEGAGNCTSRRRWRLIMSFPRIWSVVFS